MTICHFRPGPKVPGDRLSRPSRVGRSSEPERACGLLRSRRNQECREVVPGPNQYCRICHPGLVGEVAFTRSTATDGDRPGVGPAPKGSRENDMAMDFIGNASARWSSPGASRKIRTYFRPCHAPTRCTDHLTRPRPSGHRPDRPTHDKGMPLAGAPDRGPGRA